MKTMLIAAVILFTGISRIFAQSTMSVVSYGKTQQPSLMLVLPYTEEVTEGTILSNLKKTGYNPETKGSLFWKQSKTNGFYVFKGVILPDAGQTLDLYFKVEQKGKKKDEQSAIYLLASKGGENFIAPPDADPAVYDATKKFLDGFTSQTASYKLGLDIKAQEDAVKAAEKKLTKQQDDEKDMAKRIEKLQNEIEKLQNDIKTSQSDQEKQKAVIETERTKLATLRGTPGQ